MDKETRSHVRSLYHIAGASVALHGIDAMGRENSFVEGIVLTVLAAFVWASAIYRLELSNKRAPNHACGGKCFHCAGPP